MTHTNSSISAHTMTGKSEKQQMNRVEVPEYLPSTLAHTIRKRSFDQPSDEQQTERLEVSQYLPSTLAHTIRLPSDDQLLDKQQTKTLEVPEYLPSTLAHTIRSSSFDRPSRKQSTGDLLPAKRVCRTDSRLGAQESDSRTAILVKRLRARERAREAGIPCLLAYSQKKGRLQAEKQRKRAAMMEDLAERWTIPISVQLEHYTDLPDPGSGSNIGPRLKEASFTGRLNTMRTFHSVCAELQKAYVTNLAGLHRKHGDCQVQMEVNVSGRTVTEENWFPFLTQQTLVIKKMRGAEPATPVLAMFSCNGGERR